MKIKEKLVFIQKELKAPKNQRNNFGNYNYRSCEDILEALKPILDSYKASLTISDSVELIGNRYYIVAEARLENVEEEDTPIVVRAYAREEEKKSGMSEAQITGSSSSYARKYCLNGMFLIDDTADPDTMDNRDTTVKKVVDKKPTIEKKQTVDPKDCKCSVCGKPFEDIITADGKEYKAAELYIKSKNKYGKPICKDCVAKENETKEENK